jgi:predicted phage tail protein
MKKLLLHGLLKKLACGSLMIKAGNFDDIVKCLQVNFPKLGARIRGLNHIFDSVIIVIDGKIVSDSQLLNQNIRNCKVIELLPVQVFSAFFTAAATATLLTKALVFAANVIVVSALSFGISFLISKLLTPKDPKQVKTSSYLLNAKTNIAARNAPIPIGYGKLRVGSLIVSTFVTNFDYSQFNPAAGAGSSIGYVGGIGAGSGGNVLIKTLIF